MPNTIKKRMTLAELRSVAMQVFRDTEESLKRDRAEEQRRLPSYVPTYSIEDIQRKFNGVGITKIAEIIGVHRNTVNNWKNRSCSPPAHYIPKLSILLGISQKSLIWFFCYGKDI